MLRELLSDAFPAWGDAINGALERLRDTATIETCESPAGPVVG
jgi:hypothetical protein